MEFFGQEHLNALAVVGYLMAIPALLTAWWQIRHTLNRERAQYQISVAMTEPIAIVSFVDGHDGHRLSILLEKENAEPRIISGAYLYFIRIANGGFDSFTREDFIPKDPFRLEIQGANVLDVSVDAVSRDATGLTVGAIETVDDRSVVPLGFDLLDEGDGVLLRVLVEGPAGSIKVAGTLRHLPKGVRVEDYSTALRGTSIGIRFGGILFVVFSWVLILSLSLEWMLSLEQPWRGILILGGGMAYLTFGTHLAARAGQRVVKEWEVKLLPPVWARRAVFRQERQKFDSELMD